MKMVTVTTPGLVTIISLFIILISSTGCVYKSHIECQKIAHNSFTNQAVNVKVTSYRDQFIARCEDGSIWEIRVNNYTGDVVYKNCLFDSLYKLPNKPLLLEYDK